MRLIHLTDPHLSNLDGLTFRGLRGKRRSGYLSWYKNRRHVHDPLILDRLTESVKAQQADLVLLTGDLVHIGLEPEMIEAAEWMQRLGPPEKVVFVPGNHDNYAPDSLAAMYRHWGSYLPEAGGYGGDYSSPYPLVHERQDLKLLGANTSCVTRIFSATGELGQDQRGRLAGALERAPGDQRFMCLLIHHPPLPGLTKKRKALRDSAQLRDLVVQNPPDLVLYGHLHCNREHLLGPTRIFCTASASSVNNASYRIFDLEKSDSGWRCRMRLMKLQNGGGSKPSFAVAAEADWLSQAF